MDLHQKTCTPCQGGIPPLSAKEAEPLAAKTPEWRLEDDATHLTRDFKFANYAKALDFVNAISAIAEREGHHPDVRFGWGYASVTLFTHKIHGLHENDFIMAAKFDRAFSGTA